MRYSVFNKDEQLVPAPNATESAENYKFWYLPRIRCHDCPGKLYTPGPEMTVGNFEVHLKNRFHREKVEQRMAREGIKPSTPSAAAPAAGEKAASVGPSAAAGAGGSDGGRAAASAPPTASFSPNSSAHTSTPDP